MIRIYNPKELQEWDEFTIKNTPISSIDLMEKAAEACTKKILGTYLFEKVSIFSGSGNNGGDGVAIARLLAECEYEVTLYQLGDFKSGSKDLQINHERLPESVTIVTVQEGETFTIETDLIIDALFGSGLNRPVTGWIGKLIQKINAHSSPTVSIDLPSGLFAGDNRSNRNGAIIKADLTLSIQTPKMAFFYADYAHYCGTFIPVDIGLLPTFEGKEIANMLTYPDVQLKSIGRFAHKGHKGYLTIIGGLDKMTGAILMAGKAAFRTGCGYVGICSDLDSFTPLMTTLPEAIWIGDHFAALPEKMTALAIGPGLGTTDNSKTWLMSILQQVQLPIVIDADAINLLAENQSYLSEVPKNSILTPHLKELTRLIGVADSPEELLDKQIRFSMNHELFLIQKGAFSKLTTPSGEVFINPTGNEGMATAGMGDALTGIIGSFLAQGYSPLEAAQKGMFYHGLAGDLVAQKNGKLGMLASDLIEAIPRALNHF